MAGVYDQSHAATLLDSYEYAMYGKIYKWKQEKPNAAVCVLRPHTNAPQLHVAGPARATEA